MSNPGITGTDLRDWVAKIIYTDLVNEECAASTEANSNVPDDEELEVMAHYAYRAADIFCAARTVKIVSENIIGIGLTGDGTL